MKLSDFVAVIGIASTNISRSLCCIDGNTRTFNLPGDTNKFHWIQIQRQKCLAIFFFDKMFEAGYPIVKHVCRPLYLYNKIMSDLLGKSRKY